MSNFFAPDPGKLEIIPWYADNEICLQEVRFSISADEWSEFQKSVLFRELVEYLDSRRIPDKHIDSYEQVCKLENLELNENSSFRDNRESLLKQVRRLSRRRRKKQ